MGKVRSEHVKKIARELVELHPDKFSTDFQTNKRGVESLVQVSSRKIRNRIAGYITRLRANAEAEEVVVEEDIEKKR